MDKDTEQFSLWGVLESITENLTCKRLADVFRFISFQPSEAYGPHEHLRIEINYVKKGNCILCLETGCVTFRKGEVMIIAPHARHRFEAGPEGAVLMQLEFLPEIFARFNFSANAVTGESVSAFLFSEENRLIKIVDNAPIIHTVQNIINELEQKNACYQYLVMMYYAELLVLIYRHLDETTLPVCTNEFLKKAIAYIRQNYHLNINIGHVARHVGVSERYLRRLFAQHLNLAPLDYLNRIRINKAVELLRNTELLVKGICFQCGFQSPQYFSRVFKRQMGISPYRMLRRHNG